MLRTAVVVSESKRVDHYAQRIPLPALYHGIVIDEFGGVFRHGNYRDILELIVGESEDGMTKEDDIDFRQLSRHTDDSRAGVD